MRPADTELRREGTYVRDGFDRNRLELVRYWQSEKGSAHDPVSCSFADPEELRQFVRSVVRFAKKQGVHSARQYRKRER